MKALTWSLAGGCVVLLVSAANTCEADSPSYYTYFDTGPLFLQNSDFSENGSAKVSVGFNTGVRADVVVGCNLSDSLALEIEPGFIWSSVDTLNGNSLAPGESIDLYSIPLLINVVYRYQNSSRFTPYVGAGIGADVGLFQGSLPRVNVGDMTAAFAFQIQVGVKYALNDHTSVGLGYKFFGTTDQDYSFDVGRIEDRVSFNGNYDHAILLNFTYNF